MEFTIPMMLMIGIVVVSGLPSAEHSISSNVTLAGIDLSSLKPPWPAPPGSTWPEETLMLTELPTAAESRCTTDRQGSVTCTHESIDFKIGGQTRTVHYQRPIGDSKPKGTVFLFHGWNLYADFGWSSPRGWDTYGITNKVLTIKKLLDAGYVVVTPNAKKPAGYWDTNQAPYNTADLKKWSDSPDDALVLAMLAAVGDGRFGSGTSLEHVHAVGFSSGGYMTSRMAYNYEGRFRSLVVGSASYFYCGGEYCPGSVASKLSSIYKTHPPTLFLHGTSDSLVPARTSETYYKDLKANGVKTKRVTSPGVDHQWLKSAPSEILGWIEAH